MAKIGLPLEEKKLIKLNDQGGGIPSIPTTSCEPNTSECVPLKNSPFEIEGRLHHLRKKIKKPYDLMRYALEELLTHRNSWSDDLVSDIPKSWVKLGEMILLDPKSFANPIWEIEGNDVWPAVCICLNAKKLGRRYAIQPDGFRTPKVEMLWGENSWVTLIDNKISYSWDINKCMFSPGNATERHRISLMDCHDETIVDLYAGIGYFTLPFVRHANASYVHACEWNPAAVEALRYNLEKNNVADKCSIHEGDNREVAPINVADRVVMGLIPSCEQGIIPACKALKSCSGGILHMHENVSSYAKYSKSENHFMPFSFNNEYLKLVRDSCEDCASILSYLSDGNMVINKIDSESELLVPNGLSVTLTWEGGYCKPTWNTASPIVWKRREWFIQAIHFSHKVCNFISNYHQVSWKVEVLCCHHIKSYAPHIDHLVFDLKCSPAKSS